MPASSVTNPATTASITASVAAFFTPANTLGAAAGSRTWRKIVDLEALTDRSSVRYDSGVDRNPSSDAIEADGYEVTVEDVEGTRISSVTVSEAVPEDQESTD